MQNRIACVLVWGLLSEDCWQTPEVVRLGCSCDRSHAVFLVLQAPTMDELSVDFRKGLCKNRTYSIAKTE